MNNISIKAALHERIETINDDKILEALYTLLENTASHHEDYKLSEEQLTLLIERDEQYQNGEMKTLSLVELKSEIKNKFKYGV